MAFRMNKLRDFYLVMNKILTLKTSKVDPVDSVLQDRLKFKQFTAKASESGVKNIVKSTIIENQDILGKVVSALLKEENDKKKLIDILRNLNSKHEYAQIAQALLSELLPRFDAEEFLDAPDFKGPAQNELKEAIKIMNFYSAKHSDRAERGLKRAYFPEYVLSQMTIEEKLTSISRSPSEWKEVKTKSAVVKSQIAAKKKSLPLKKVASDNLFAQ